MADINGKCPRCGKEELESYKTEVVINGKKYIVWHVRCKSCRYDTK